MQVTSGMDSVNIRRADNGGVVVSCYVPGSKDEPGKDLTYVYDSMEAAMKEVPGMMSVMGEDKKVLHKMADDQMKDKANKGEYMKEDKKHE